jgi:hypothetical protein
MFFLWLREKLVSADIRCLQSDLCNLSNPQSGTSIGQHPNCSTEGQKRAVATDRHPPNGIAPVGGLEMDGSATDVAAIPVPEMDRSTINVVTVPDKSASVTLADEQVPRGEVFPAIQDDIPDGAPSAIHRGKNASIRASVNPDNAGSEGGVDTLQEKTVGNDGHGITRVQSVAKDRPTKRARRLQRLRQQNTTRKELRRARTLALSKHPNASQEDAIVIVDSGDDNQHG